MTNERGLIVTMGALEGENKQLKTEINRLQNAAQNLVIAAFWSSERVGLLTGQEFKKMLLNCGFVAADKLFKKPKRKK